MERRDWVKANDACRRDILKRLKASGPLPMRELPDTCAKPWGSTGWTNNRNVEKLLDFMVARGEVAVAGRQGRERLWDLASGVYPDDPVVPPRRRHAPATSGGSAHSASPEPARRRARWSRGTSARSGEPAVVEGVKGEWRVDPSLLDRPFAGRTALLSPFDRLVHDRKRAVELFDFDYQLEMYKPAAKRRWGYYALPVLHRDRLIGKVDATADRKAGVLRVDAIHEDEPFTKTTAAAVRRELKDLARWLELEPILPA